MLAPVHVLYQHSAKWPDQMTKKSRRCASSFKAHPESKPDVTYPNDLEHFAGFIYLSSSCPRVLISRTF